MFKGCHTIGPKGWLIGCKGPKSSQVPYFQLTLQNQYPNSPFILSTDPLLGFGPTSLSS